MSTALRVVLLVVEAAVLLGVRLSMQPWERRPGRPPEADANADFARYRQLASALRFADRRRDFDQAARPQLLRIYGQVLAERHDLRIVANRARARELMGPAALLLDEPDRHALELDREFDARPGVARDVLEEIVSKLEELSS